MKLLGIAIVGVVIAYSAAIMWAVDAADAMLKHMEEH